MEKHFISMSDLGNYEEHPWYREIETDEWDEENSCWIKEVVESSNPDFNGIYGSKEYGWIPAYWDEAMEQPWTGPLYYDRGLTLEVDPDAFEKWE